MKPLRTVRERDVERHLLHLAAQAGALVRKVQWLGRNHAPDRVLMLPATPGQPRGRTVWVELKAPGQQPRPGQQREHQRMRLAGQEVITLDSPAAVDAFFETLATPRCWFWDTDTRQWVQAQGEFHPSRDYYFGDQAPLTPPQ